MSERAYITILRWPKSFSLEDRVRALAEALGLEPFAARQRAGQEPPLVVARVDALVAKDLVGALRAQSISAFGITKTQLARFANASPVKRLTPAEGCAAPMYMVELWKGEPLGLRASDIFLLVRATLDKSKDRMTADPTSIGYGRRGSIRGLRNNQTDTASHETEVHLSQVLDIYLTDSTLLRLNSDRVSFDVLGKDRAFSAIENMDKLALRLASEAPQAIVDTGFSRFRPPPDIASDTVLFMSSTTTSTQRDETAAFDFYSAWTYAMNRGLSGGSKASPA